MATENGNAGVLEWAASTVANHVKNIPAAIKKDLTQGTGPSILLDAANDIRSTMHGVFFGQAEGVSQPGTPTNPLQSEVAESRRADAGMDVETPKVKSVSAVRERGKADAGSVYGPKQQAPAKRPSPSEIATSTQLYRPQTASQGQEQGNSR
jgi:hypothetical protein